MSNFSLASMLYILVIFVFAIIVGSFMSYQLSSGGYNPTHSKCEEVIYTSKACVRGDIVYFDFSGDFETADFTMKINDLLIGELFSKSSLKKELPTQNEFRIQPEISGYVCHDKSIYVNLEDIEEC